jgi:F0F1-type ATP synthase assembly protein I
MSAFWFGTCSDIGVVACEKFHKLIRFTAVAKDGLGSGAAAYAGMGLQFAVAICLFAYVGAWIDRRVGTSPLFLIAGVFLGAGGGFYSMIRRVKEQSARNAAPRDSQKP